MKLSIYELQSIGVKTERSIMSRKIKWGVIGTAGIAKSCTIPGMKEAENCELYAIAGRSIDKANSFKEEFGFEKAYGSYDELLQDENVEAVYIPLTNEIHYEWIMKSMKAGKHVLCEKPMAPNAKQTAELFAAAKENNVLLMEAFAYLHSPYVKLLKEEFDKKSIGDINYIESAFMTQGLDESNFRTRKECYGGAMYDLGCYSTSLILWLMGKKPVSVQAMAEYTPKGVDIFSSAYLKFDDGVRASFNCGMVLTPEHDCRWDRVYIAGTKGYIKTLTEFNQSGEFSITVCVDGKEEVIKAVAPQNYRLEVEQFGRCILGEETTHVTPEFSIMNSEVMDEILQKMGY